MANTVIGLQTSSPSVQVTAVAEGLYQHSPDHADRMVNRLIEFFRKPRNSAWLRYVVGPQIQAIEDVLWALYLAYDIDVAVGEQLDKLGAIVGELRNDRNDAAYRVAVKTRLLVNQSEGSPEELLTIVDTADPTLTVSIREYYPAALLWRWSGTFSAISARDLFTLVKQAKPAGVTMHAVIDTAGDFRWGTVAAAGSASTRAFGSVGGTNGGELQQVLD